MTLKLPGEKLRKIRKKCQAISVRELSKFLGLLTSSIQAIFPAPIHYRHLQRLKNGALTKCQSYEALVILDHPAREEILWWRDHLQACYGRALFQNPVDLIFETDASRKTWGAYCQGLRTGGPWSCKGKRLHINCLELLAGSLAITTFTKSRACAHVKLLTLSRRDSPHWQVKSSGFRQSKILKVPSRCERVKEIVFNPFTTGLHTLTSKIVWR